MGSKRAVVVVDPDADGIMPWERQPGESEPAWAAFVLYRDMGNKRSLSRVAEAIVLQTSGDVETAETLPGLSRKRRKVRTVSTVLWQAKEWSRTRNWRERCEAWDRHQDRERLDVMREQMRRQQFALSHPANVLLKAMNTYGALEDDLAGILAASLREDGRRPVHLPAAWRELMQAIGAGASGTASLVNAERLVRVIQGEAARNERSDRDGADGADGSAEGFLADLPGNQAVLAGINAIGLGAEGYALVAGVLRLGSDAGSVDARATPRAAE